MRPHLATLRSIKIEVLRGHRVPWDETAQTRCLKYQPRRETRTLHHLPLLRPDSSCSRTLAPIRPSPAEHRGFARERCFRLVHRMPILQLFPRPAAKDQSLPQNSETKCSPVPLHDAAVLVQSRAPSSRHVNAERGAGYALLLVRTATRFLCDRTSCPNP